MKSLISIFVLLTFVTAFNCFSAETKEEAKTATQSTAVVSDAKSAAPNLFMTYNYYRYDMTGKSTANTGIYKFGAATVDLHLLTATYLYSSSWTLLTFVPYVKNAVETIYEPTDAGINYKLKDNTSGLGDVRLMAVTPVSLDASHLTMVDVGMTLPTGSINEYFTSSPTQRAAYNMQLGSGTPDFIVGTTVTNTMDQLVSSARGEVTVRGGKNANGYALGNQFLAKLTSMYGFNSFVTAGVVGNYKIRGAVVGKDEKYELFNAYQSGSDPQIAGDGHQYYHGPQANWDADVVAKFQSPAFSSMTAAFEFGLPVAQGSSNKDDIKLDLNYYAAATLNASF